MIRSLSFSEISTAATCPAQWDFAYGGHLAGDALTPKVLHPSLSGGRAWGAAVAAWHSQPNQREPASRLVAHDALRASFARDIAEQIEKGIWIDLRSSVEAETRLSSILDHYMQTSDPLPFQVEQLERELNFALPSRTGIRSSNRYRFVGYLDAHLLRPHRRDLVEYKLRRSLTPPDIIQIQPQTRWYVLGAVMEGEDIPTTVHVDERFNEPPQPPRIVQGKKRGTFVPSHAKDQLTTAEWYVAVCAEYGVEPHDETVNALRARIWQQRIPVDFREDELETARRELVSAAQRIARLDSGQEYPIRNAQTRLCRPCKFRKICPAPDDRMFVDLYFDRKPPKRLRDVVQADGSSDPHSAGEEKASGGTDTASSAESVHNGTVRSPSFADARGGSHSSARSASRKGVIEGQTSIDDFLERGAA